MILSKDAREILAARQCFGKTLGHPFDNQDEWWAHVQETFGERAEWALVQQLDSACKVLAGMVPDAVAEAHAAYDEEHKQALLEGIYDIASMEELDALETASARLALMEGGKVFVAAMKKAGLHRTCDEKRDEQIAVLAVEAEKEVGRSAERVARTAKLEALLQ